MFLFPEHVCIWAGLSVFQTEEVNNVGISGFVRGWLAVGSWIWGEGGQFSVGLRVKQLRLGVKEILSHTTSKSPCALGSSRLSLCWWPILSTWLASNPSLLMESSAAGTAFYSFLSFHPRSVSSKPLPSLTGDTISACVLLFSNTLFKPKSTHRPLWNPGVKGGWESRGNTFCSQQHFEGLMPSEWHLSLGVNSKLHHKWTF